MTGQWITEDLPNGVIVRPLDDIVVHTCCEVCVCAPRVETRASTCFHYAKPLLAVKKVIVHQAMDGRR